MDYHKKHNGKMPITNEIFEQKTYELGDLNIRRGLSGDIAVYHFYDNLGNGIPKKKWQVEYIHINNFVSFIAHLISIKQ